jgi:LysM repeat protein
LSRPIFKAILLFMAVGLVNGCSSNFDEGARTRLTSPSDDRYVSTPRSYPEPRRQITRYDQPVQANPSNCLSEPVARYPFPAYVTVARGENLCRIAKRYETTVQAIVDINRLPSPIIAVGTRLRLPNPQYYSQNPFGELRRR